MSRNTHERNVGPAHGLDQANRISHVDIKTCCSCKLDTFGTVNGRCICCGHHFCEMCSENEYARLALPLTDEAHRVLPTPRHMPISISTVLPPPPHLTTTSESNQPENLINHEERDPPGKAWNEVNKEQEHGMRPQGEPLEKQCSPTIPKGKKRKLNMEKCQRCREDKQGCIWKSSEKCDRCIGKGFPCSERTRVTRPRKHAPKHASPVHNDTSPSVDLDLFKERFEKWTFLKSYHKMMTMAMDRIRELEKDLKTTFSWFDLPYLEPETARRKFRDLVDRSQSALEHALSEIVTTEHGLNRFPARSFTESQSLALLLGPSDTLCPECCPTRLKSTIIKAIESLDVCGAFLAQQHLFQKHSDLFHPDNNDEAVDLQSREMERYTMSSTEIPRQAEAILGSVDPSSFGLYHYDVHWLASPEWKLTSIDCLGRTPLHRSLDRVSQSMHYFANYEDIVNILNEDLIEMSWWCRQDILGRTPLHILCQFNDLDLQDVGFERILRAGANLSQETIYGSLPLHYLAANGNFRSCKLLLEHETKFNVGAKDEYGRTALDYAIFNKHDKIADLLMPHYEEAGLVQDIEAADNIKLLVERDWL